MKVIEDEKKYLQIGLYLLISFANAYSYNT